MSTESAQKFINDLQQDSNLYAQFSVASPNSFDGVVDFAYVKGYVFTKDELEKALKQNPDSKVANELRQYNH